MNIGPVDQLGDHPPRKRDVAGSIPAGSTITRAAGKTATSQREASQHGAEQQRENRRSDSRRDGANTPASEAVRMTPMNTARACWNRTRWPGGKNAQGTNHPFGRQGSSTPTRSLPYEVRAQATTPRAGSYPAGASFR